MTLPNILLSGGPRSLLIDLEKAREKLTDARGSLYNATPHPRDYVTLDRWEMSFTEHCARIAAVEKVEDELVTIIGHLITGGAR